ncbi:MAG: zinc-ribbon domain-containing protein [Desulfarculus sp.]|nr:MAG: zinc-ribbon domain-containing protein [Desulfarculus sp.]
MAFCNQCGATLQEGDRFCPACGAPVKGAPAAPAAVPGPAGAQQPAAPQYQSVGIRFGSQIIDGIIILAFYMLMGYWVASTYGGLKPEGWELKGGPAILVVSVSFIFAMAYFILLEAFWNGQTLGKKLTGIRVVQTDGQPITLAQAVIRNVLRVVDGLVFYLVGAILVWRSPLRQRLGDRVADTVVVKKR